MCVAWTDARRGDDDALARCSTDRGRTWPGLLRLNDDKPGNGSSQYLPRLSLSPQGRLDALFLDRRRDPGNKLYDVYFTYSPQAGAAFAPSVRLTRFGSDSAIGQRYLNRSAKGQYEFGSRLGLLSRESSVLAAWPDTHNSGPESTAQDLFVAEVSSLPGGAQARVGSRGIIGLTGGAVLVLLAAWRLTTRRRRRPLLEAQSSR
jgi:hypothetical protein